MGGLKPGELLDRRRVATARMTEGDGRWRGKDEKLSQRAEHIDITTSDGDIYHSTGDRTRQQH